MSKRIVNKVDIEHAIGDALGRIRYEKDHTKRRQQEMALWMVVESICEYMDYKNFNDTEFKQNILEVAKMGHENVFTKHDIYRALGLNVS